MAITRQVSFTGGISDNSRAVTFKRKGYFASNFQISKHFDIFSNPDRITPYRNLAADTNDGSSSTGMKQYAVKDFVYSSTAATLYGLGQSGTGLAKIFNKADATNGNWTVPASSTGNGAVWNGCFFEYKDYLLGFQGTVDIFKYGLLSGTPSITNSIVTLASTITSVAQGLIAPGDGNAYMFYNNVVVRITPALAVTDSAKTLPANYKITSACNYGNYIAIAGAPISTFNGNSKLFIWDKSSDLFTDTIDLGEGEVRIVETIEGMVVCVIDRYLNNATGAGRGSMIIQTYSGGQPQVVKEIFTQALTGKSIPNYKAVRNNRLFFAAKIMKDSAGTTYDEGLWSFGRKNASYPYSFTLDIIDENINTSGIQGFGTAGNYFFIAHSADGSIDKTSLTATYTFTSILESQIFSFGDVADVKRLNQISVDLAPLPASSTVTIKIKVDNDSAWTTIGTITTTNKMARDFFNIESTGADFPTFQEIKVRIESTGGAEILGFDIDAITLIGSEN